jgi:hypothetical protein
LLGQFHELRRGLWCVVGMPGLDRPLVVLSCLRVRASECEHVGQADCSGDTGLRMTRLGRDLEQAFSLGNVAMLYCDQAEVEPSRARRRAVVRGERGFVRLPRVGRITAQFEQDAEVQRGQAPRLPARSPARGTPAGTHPSRCPARRRGPVRPVPPRRRRVRRAAHPGWTRPPRCRRRPRGGTHSPLRLGRRASSVAHQPAPVRRPRHPMWSAPTAAEGSVIPPF